MKFLLSLICMATVILSAGAYAKHHDPEEKIEYLTEELSLNTEQQDSLRAFFAEKEKLMKEYHAKKEERKEAHKDGKGKKHSGPMADLMSKDQISVDDVYQAIDKKRAKKREKREVLLTAFINFRNSLSAEQREKGKKKLHRMFHKAVGKKGCHKKGKHH